LARIADLSALAGGRVGARQLFHGALDRRDLYARCKLAVELAEVLASIGEAEEAGETVKSHLKRVFVKLRSMLEARRCPDARPSV
jgi:hypothetical protein